MAVFLQPIYTQTVGSGGASSITFNNIPQTFTDLKLVISGRVNSGLIYSNATLAFNGSSTGYSNTRLTGNGSSASSDRITGAGFLYIGEVDGDAATANTFGSLEVYIPNYTSSNYKQALSDKAIETNATTAYQGFHANLWSNTSAITSMTIGQGHSGYLQYSTFSLYGILRQGV